jgi:1-deoxy-D-xylulose-5-phosphate reductoisomerase
LNAANEVSNQAFREGKIGFLHMADVNREVMEDCPFVKKPSLEDYLQVDQHARQLAEARLTAYPVH